MTKRQKLATVVVILIGVVAAVDSLPGAPEQPGQIGACDSSRQFVRNRLKAPATARFTGSCNAVEIKDNPGAFVVTNYVDAQNSFGALIRTQYVAKVKYITHHDAKLNHWFLINLSM